MTTIIPNELNITLNTSIPGFQKIKYLPSMTIPSISSKEKTVSFNPLVKLQKSVIDKVPKDLRVKEFFNKQHIEKFFQNNDVSDITKTIDLDKIYDGLVEEILKTQLGGMLQMFGGKGALQPLRDPIKAKIAEIIKDLTSNPEKSSGTLSALTDKVENIIDARLEELTPQMVKQIVKDMINEHLSWLVLWGGVFGGLIGFGFSFVKL